MGAIQQLAAEATERVDGREVAGLDPVTITTIFSTVIQGIIECRKAKNPLGAAGALEAIDVQNSLHAEYEANPQASENQIRHRIIRTARRDHDRRLRPRESRELADALISRGLEATQQQVAAAYSE